MEFSVAMCVYGKDDPVWFCSAVDSILNQTAAPDEVVLVVDGPVPEALAAVIAKYEAMPIFKVIRFAENRGHGDARRASLEHCSHELVALMDADDLSLPHRFRQQLACFAADPQLDIVGGNITEFVGDEANIVGSRVVPAEDGEIRQYMKKRCPMNQMTVMFRRQTVEKAGGYIDWFCEEDYYLWLRMAMNGARFANLQEALVNVRVGEDMYRRRGGLRYFRSEAKLQKFMLQNRIISLGTYLFNVVQRLILQVLLPNRLRGWVFQKFARRSVK